MNSKPAPSLSRAVLWLFGLGLGGAGVAIGIAAAFFPTRADLVGVFLTAIGLFRTMGRLLDDNRRAIWEDGVSAYRANGRLAAGMLGLFFGILTAYLLLSLSVSGPTRQKLLGFQLERYGSRYSLVTDIQFGAFGDLLEHNGIVLCVFLLLGFLYQEGGTMLILAWNASIWGSVFGYLIGNQRHADAFEAIRYGLRTMAVLFPHLAAEGIAYILAALAGIFAVRGLLRHPFGSDRQARVLRAVAALVAVAALALALGAWIESTATPWLVRRIVPEPLLPRPF